MQDQHTEHPATAIHPLTIRMSSKPQSPRNSPRVSGHSTFNGHIHAKPLSSSAEPKRSKPTFTTCLDYPAPTPVAAPAFSQPEDGELSRAQRRSKVEALTKIDRAGTPVQLLAGPTGTSFVPTRQASAGPSGPSPPKNPLHRPPVVNPAFDINSNRQSAPRSVPSKSGTRLFGLEDCPAFYPTLEQFQDPMAYIDSIGPKAKPYGICKIIPPEGWHMPFALDPNTFRFRTRLQRLNSLEAASRAKINFLEQLTMYHLQQGDSTVTIPNIDHKPVDLWLLRKEVNKLGGHDEVNRMKGWPVITQTLGYDEFYAPQIKSAYIRIILPFDNFAIRARSVSGSPLTPMPSTTASKLPNFANESPTSPTRMGRMAPTRASPRRTEETSRSTSPPRTSLSMPNGPSKAPSPINLPARSDSAAPNIPSVKVPGFSSRDGSESELSDEEVPLRKPDATGKFEYQKGEVCEVCRRGDGADKILLCDGCDRGFHTYCLDPPLSSVPSNEEWFCTPCLLSQGDDFGFEEGEDHSLASFHARDLSFSCAWWQRHRPSSSTDQKDLPATSRTFGKIPVSEDDVEQEFWRLTESTNDTVETEYGADVHSSTHGSASPTLETDPLNKYSADGWNLNNMPILPKSLLRYIKSDISGMTVPWIYVGMMFSAFCWHNEDHYTYSVNYMHWGETKTWYGIPGSDAEKFEAAMKSEAPELFEQQPSLLYQLVTMMNPGRLTEAGVRVVACDQRPNEFVITFPKAYHCGFNHGMNFNEAVNFALPDWLPNGKECVVRYKEHIKAPVFSHNELLITITLFSETIQTAIWLKDCLAEMVTEETARRDKLRAQVPLLTELLSEEDCPEDQYQCCICKGFCYLSQIICPCTKLVACVDHADQLCSCEGARRILRKRYSEAQLEEILLAVENRAALPNVWRARFNALMDTPRPALKSMRAILADGERIAYPIPEIHHLRTLVTRANAWVEAVSALATRKSTGRRKKGRQAEEDELNRSPEALAGLLQEADRLSFDAPEILLLRQMLLAIDSFRAEASLILGTPEAELDLEQCSTALILGRDLNIDLPEVSSLQNIVNRLEWYHRIEEEVDDRAITYDDVKKLLRDSEDYNIPAEHPAVLELGQRALKGIRWKKQVEKLLERDSIPLEDVSLLIEGQELVPTIPDKMRQLEHIYKTAVGWQATARAQLSSTGSANAAQRLCKAVKTAQGPVGRVDIPEISELQTELDFHAQWQNGLANVLGIQPKNLSSTLNDYLQAVEQHLQPADLKPSDQFGCFCRTTPGPIMVTCGLCSGQYHPRCVEVAPKNAAKTFWCQMCRRGSYDDRSSANAFFKFADSNRYNFLFPPAEYGTLCSIIDIAVEFARVLVTVADPLDQAVPCRDFDLLAHYARKMFNLPFTFDAENTKTHQRIVFELWLYKRMADAAHPSKPRMRPRKPRLVLKETQACEGDLKCVCLTPPFDELVTIHCTKCRQGFHASCVGAPTECLGPQGKVWRCPLCTVREAKKNQHGGVNVRVQMSNAMGTDRYVDYRSTINTFATSPLEYVLARDPHAIIIECIDYVKPVIPEGFVPPTVEDLGGYDDEHGYGRRKKRKTEEGGSVNGTASNGHTEEAGLPTPTSLPNTAQSGPLPNPRSNLLENFARSMEAGSHLHQMPEPPFHPSPSNGSGPLSQAVLPTTRLVSHSSEHWTKPLSNETKVTQVNGA